jgi:hypothetical protein
VVEGSSLLLPMWRFSLYRVFNVSIGPVCELSEEMLDPPPPLPDYYYVGTVVIINDVYSEQFSTLPPDYEETHNGKVRGIRYVDETTGCDIMILHWYRPNGAAPTPTPDPGGGRLPPDIGGWPPPGWGGWPPQPPPGLRINPQEIPCLVYLGHVVLLRWFPVAAEIDHEKLLWEAGNSFFFDLSRERQPPGFDVMYIYGNLCCDDWDECTEDWCDIFTGECVNDPIPDCVPTTCECTEDALITSEGCTWADANECTGLHSACSHEGIHPPYRSGQRCCWGSCCITIICP